MSDPFHEGPAAAKARKTRSLAIAIGLVAFVVLVFAVTLVQFDKARRNASPAPAGATAGPVASGAAE